MPISYKQKIYTTSGWLTSYKRKLYMGRNIEWNQLVDKSKFQDISSLSGISVTNNNDGSVMFDGTKTTSNDVFFSCGTYQITENHRYYLYGAPEGGGRKTYFLYTKNKSYDLLLLAHRISNIYDFPLFDTSHKRRRRRWRLFLFHQTLPNHRYC